VSMAVATPSGLITPIVHGADSLGLEAISAKARDLVRRARENKLGPEEFQGGTVSISNMGMNDAIDRFNAIINPPQSTIVAIGTVKKVATPEAAMEDDADADLDADRTPAVVWDEQIVLTGSFDHRVVDGAVGAEFMAELKKVLENPLQLLL